jgi:hypothetical protein
MGHLDGGEECDVSDPFAGVERGEGRSGGVKVALRGSEEGVAENPVALFFTTEQVGATECERRVGEGFLFEEQEEVAL